MEDEFVKYKEFVVRYKDRVAIINPWWLVDRNLKSGSLEKLKALHLERFKIEEAMDQDGADMKSLLEDWGNIQFDLQKTWGFPLDSAYHKVWEIPACSCPTLDNEDRYPYKHIYMSTKCKVHGIGE